MKDNLKNWIFIIFLFFILGICLFYTKKTDEFIADDFLNTKYEKTIYLVWKNKQNQGLGDRIRGCITLYQYCKHNKINFKIDATNDACSHFLKNVFSPDYDAIKDKEIVTHHSNNHVKLPNLIQKELLKKDTIYIFTNVYPMYILDENDYEFSKFICEPNDALALEVDEKVKQLPDSFTIKHFRFRDYVYKKDINSNDEIFLKCFNILKSNYKTTDVLFTNSNNFKEYAKQQLNIKTVDCDNELCKLGHSGYNSDIDSIKSSFIEFFIISRATNVESYSCYNWPSNFSYWPSTIYNIPFQNIYVEDTKNKDNWEDTKY